MGRSIFLTTGKDTADIEKIFGLYKLRWRIEIIFKSWKSNRTFDRIHHVSKIQLWAIRWIRQNIAPKIKGKKELFFRKICK